MLCVEFHLGDAVIYQFIQIDASIGFLNQFKKYEPL
jgi:hypothetical protein